MAAKHWIRDAQFFAGAYTSDIKGYSTDLLNYHFLRVAGFEWVWECDGEVGGSAPTKECQHAEDGSMEASGTTKWLAEGGGATVVKDTTEKHTGAQSLKVTSSAADEGVRSAALIDMRQAGGSATLTGIQPAMAITVQSADSVLEYLSWKHGKNIVISAATNPQNVGTWPITSWNHDSQLGVSIPGGIAETGTVTWATTEPYEIVLWAFNDSGQAWDVKVDTGDGSPSSVGTIPDNGGVWTQYHFTFTLYPGAGTRQIYITDPVGGNDIYIDDVMVFRSMYEYDSYESGTDGILTNPDQFSTAGSYTPGASDVGNWLLVWDDTNNKNSGAYKIITDLGGGSVQLDLRSGTAALVTQGSLNWRIVDLNSGPEVYQFTAFSNRQRGYGLESPHTSKWRFTQRYNYGTSNYRCFYIHAAPVDTEIDVETGFFRESGPSTQRFVVSKDWVADYSSFATDKQFWNHGYSYDAAPGTNNVRCFLMTDADRSFVTWFNIHDPYTQRSPLFIGYTGADPDHPGVEEFVSMCTWQNRDNATNFLTWGSINSFFQDAVGFGPGPNLAVETGIAQEGHGTAAATAQNLSNAGPNPWSGEEQMAPLIVARDPGGVNQVTGQRASNCGLFQGRHNLVDLTELDNENYLHFENGYIWEWSGEELV